MIVCCYAKAKLKVSDSFCENYNCITKLFKIFKTKMLKFYQLLIMFTDRRFERNKFVRL